MKNNFMALKKHLFMSAIMLTGVMTSLSALGQSIETGQLGAAQAYDAGVIDGRSGGLDASLWQGTSSKMAVHLLERLPLTSKNPLVKDLMEAVVFSAGVPPEGSDSRYDHCLLYTSPSPRDATLSRMPSSA